MSTAFERFRSSGGGGASVHLSELQPAWWSPAAQWSLGDANTLSSLNRVVGGAGLSLSSFSPDRTPGPNPYRYAMTCGESSEAYAAEPAVALTGAVTVTGLFYRPRDIGGDCCLAGCGESGASLYFLWWNSNDRLEFTSGGGNWIANSLQPPRSKWCFFSLRRTAGNVVRLGYDGHYESSSSLGALPAAQPSALFRIGHYYSPSNGGTVCRLKYGGMADVCVWPTYLSDAQIAQLEAVAAWRKVA